MTNSARGPAQDEPVESDADKEPNQPGPRQADPPRFGERTEPLPAEDRRSVYRRERDEYGGIRFGVAFFGWLTATGLTVILGAVAAAIFGAFGLDDAKDATFGAALSGAIVLVVILFVAYLAGGYVAGRMARFAGVKQGVAVWIWGLVVTGVLVIVGAVAGPRFDLLTNAGILPQIRFGDTAAWGTALTIAALVVATLLGALLGGVAGMRFHRRVDRTGRAE
jgi:hypothetical protein